MTLGIHISLITSSMAFLFLNMMCHPLAIHDKDQSLLYDAFLIMHSDKSTCHKAFSTWFQAAFGSLSRRIQITHDYSIWGFLRALYKRAQKRKPWPTDALKSKLHNADRRRHLTRLNTSPLGVEESHIENCTFCLLKLPKKGRLALFQFYAGCITN